MAFSHSYPCNWIPCRWFAPSWAVCTNSPFNPTATSLSGNFTLEPNPDRHEKSPLAAATGNGLTERKVHASTQRVLEVSARLQLHWKDRFGYCAPLKPVTTVQKLAGFWTFEETTLPGGFFVSKAKIRCRVSVSQERQ